MDKETNQSTKQQANIHLDVLKLISVQTLSQYAAVTGIIAFEAEAAQRGIFPLKFVPSNNVVCKFNKEIPFKFICLSDISQYTRYSLSLFVEFADLNAHPSTWKYHVFKQASYSSPVHGHIDINSFIDEKSAIEQLLEAEMMSADKPDVVSCRFFNLYYLNDDMIKQLRDRDGEFGVIDLTSSDENENAVVSEHKQQDDAISSSDNPITESDVLIKDEYVDPWATIPGTAEKKD